MNLSPKAITVTIISVLWLVFQMYLALIAPLHPMLQNPLHLLFALTIIYLYVPANKKSGKNWLKGIDILCYAGIIFLLYYYVSQSEVLINRVPYISPIFSIDVVAMLVLTIVLMEAVRRVLGYTLFFFILFFVCYMWMGPYFPSIFQFGGTNLNKFTELMTMGSEGIMGTPLYTSASSLFYFIMFGVLFAKCGGGQVLMDIGMRMSSKSSGGPAKAAIISSALMGMLSGSAVANVSTTGVMTIPMMKKVGYQPEEAAAIEAVASTGGQIMPPIMGVGAFIMAEMLGVPYKTVAMAAIIPALAYYLSIMLFVTFLSARNKLQDDKKEVSFDIAPLLPRLYLLIPAAVLVYFMVSGASLMRSGMMGIYTILIINFINKFLCSGKYYISLKELWACTKQGVRQSADIAIPTAACGIIIGIVIQSGLATKISSIIASLAISNLAFALIVAMLGCMLLGMALPTVAAYLVANILFVPTLLKLNINPLSANMFVFYFGIMAQITPPVCLASFTAAGIAGADSWKTGWKGAQYALVAFLVPYIFVYDPGILLIGSTMVIIKATAVLFIGTCFLAAGMAGYLIVPMNKLERVMILTGAIFLIIPETITDVIGIGVALAAVGISVLRNRRSAH